MQLTLSERLIRKRKRDCINNLIDQVNIYLSKRVNKDALKLSWNCIILHDV